MTDDEAPVFSLEEARKKKGRAVPIWYRGEAPIEEIEQLVGTVKGPGEPLCARDSLVYLEGPPQGHAGSSLTPDQARALASRLYQAAAQVEWRR